MNERGKAAPGAVPKPTPEPGPAAGSPPDLAVTHSAAPETDALLSQAELYVTGAQGQPVSRALSERERWLATQADAALRNGQAVTPGAVLVRLEVNGLLPDSDASYLYLCYQPPGAAALEFWAGFRRAASLDLGRGLVGVASAGAPA